MNPLLDTVEPDWYGNANSLSEKHTALVAKWKGNGTLGLYSRETVESLLAECRKEVWKAALLEAAEIADEGVVQGCHGNDVMTRHNIGNELRRMAESDKTTMEGEK